MPKRLAADTAYGTGSFLAWLVTATDHPAYPGVGHERARRRHLLTRPISGSTSRRNVYICPAGETLTTTGRVHSDHAIRYYRVRARCRACPLKPSCCPNMPSRRIVRDINEDARDIARRKMKTKAFLRSRDQRKRVEMRFAHLKTHHGFERMRLRGPFRRPRRVPSRRHRSEPQDVGSPAARAAARTGACDSCVTSVSLGAKPTVRGQAERQN